MFLRKETAWPLFTELHTSATIDGFSKETAKQSHTSLGEKRYANPGDRTYWLNDCWGELTIYQLPSLQKNEHSCSEQSEEGPR